MIKGGISLINSYWKAVIRYGHLGRNKEVSVARHLEFPKETKVCEVMDVVSTMPGTKGNCIVSIREITEIEFLSGKDLEQENFYLKNLFAAVA